MAYIKKNARILKGNQLSKKSLLIKENRTKSHVKDALAVWKKINQRYSEKVLFSSRG